MLFLGGIGAFPAPLSPVEDALEEVPLSSSANSSPNKDILRIWGVTSPTNSTMSSNMLRDTYTSALRKTILSTYCAIPLSVFIYQKYCTNTAPYWKLQTDIIISLFIVLYQFEFCSSRQPMSLKDHVTCVLAVKIKGHIVQSWTGTSINPRSSRMAEFDPKGTRILSIIFMYWSWVRRLLLVLLIVCNWLILWVILWVNTPDTSSILHLQGYQQFLQNFLNTNIHHRNYNLISQPYYKHLICLL